MKKLFVSAVSLAMVASLAGCNSSSSNTSAGTYTAGTYSATEKGFGGDVTVTITTDSESITNVEIVGEDETPEKGGVAMEEIASAILDAQSTEVDTVSGATITSEAAISAAANAIAQAKGSEVSAVELSMTDGTYTATAASYAEQYGLATTGSMTMEVTVADNQITDITVTECTDTDVIGQMAFPILTENVIANQSLAVDSISGATVSSAGYMTALKDAITQAGGEDAVKALQNVEIAKAEPVGESYDTDILVIGAGMAGLSAAIEAASQGADVILLEKNLVYSSSTTRSLGYVIGAGTDVQAENDIEDTPEAFAADILALYEEEETLDADLLTTMALNSQDHIAWLEEQGVEFTDVIRKSEKGERATPRIHTTDGGGGAVTSVLVEQAEKLGVTVMMGTPATSLIQEEDGSITGAKATNDNGDDITITADSTIVAAGSYTNNAELFAELNPRINNIGYACGSGDGDAYNWFVEVGADIVNVEYTQFMYYAYGTTFEEFPEVIPNSPDNPVYDILLVGGNGERLTAEDNFCFEFTKENWNLGYNEGYAVVDQEFMDTYPILYNDVMTATIPGTDKLYGYEGETAADLADAVGINAEALEATIARYNELCDAGEDTDFGKKSEYMNKLEGTLYIIRLPQITTDGYTGARINENAQVLDTDGNVIPGLFAAGSCADGQVTSVNYYGCGTSLLTCVNFGRIAADYAVAQLNN